MPEPITLIGGSAVVAYLSKDGIKKILGPTADYLGDSLRDFAVKRGETINRIFKNAADKLGDEIEKEAEVPPKVLKSILDEGSYSTDILSVEYFGGILASSRTPRGRDDRGARLAKLVDSMSSYQIRAHFLIYSSIKDVFKSDELRFDRYGRPKMELFIPYEAFIKAMDFDENEEKQFRQILSHILSGLHSDSLLNDWLYGDRDHLSTRYPGAPSGGILLIPSVPGAELFLWAFGASQMELEHIFSPDFKAQVDGLPNLLAGTIATMKPVVPSK